MTSWKCLTVSRYYSGWPVGWNSFRHQLAWAHFANIQCLSVYAVTVWCIIFRHKISPAPSNTILFACTATILFLILGIFTYKSSTGCNRLTDATGLKMEDVRWFSPSLAMRAKRRNIGRFPNCGYLRRKSCRGWLRGCILVLFWRNPKPNQAFRQELVIDDRVYELGRGASNSNGPVRAVYSEGLQSSSVGNS